MEEKEKLVVTIRVLISAKTSGGIRSFVFSEQTSLLFEFCLLPRGQLVEFGLGEPQPLRVVLLVEVQF